MLTEGKKHEVRLMLRAGGLLTQRLIRIAHGPLCDPNLLSRPGKWRELSAAELEALGVLNSESSRVESGCALANAAASCCGGSGL